MVRILMKMIPIMLAGIMVLAACGGQAAQIAEETLQEVPAEAMMEAEAPVSSPVDEDGSDAVEPSIPHEIALRAELDEAIRQRFGYDELRVSRSIENQYFNITYVLQNVPDDSVFYPEMEELFQEIFDFYLFGDHDSLDDWYEWNDSHPEEMSAAFTFDGMNYFWIVELHGNELIFGYV